MPEPALILAQMLSPAFPVGAFAYSHGLETAIADGRIRDAGTLEAWLVDLLEHGVGAADAALVLGAMQPGAAAFARALGAGAERVTETEQQGAALARTAAALWGTDPAPAPYPVAVGRVAAALNLPPDLTLSLYLQAVLGNLISVATRAVPLGQTEGQAVLAALTPRITACTARATDAFDDISSICFAGDIAAMRHETLEPRIFRT